MHPKQLQVTAEPEVAQLVPSWIMVGAILAQGGAILAQGLMSLIGITWGNPGGSRGRQGKVTCPPGRGHLTAETQAARPGHLGSWRAPSWLGAAPSQPGD